VWTCHEEMMPTRTRYYVCLRRRHIAREATAYRPEVSYPVYDIKRVCVTRDGALTYLRASYQPGEGYVVLIDRRGMRLEAGTWIKVSEAVMPRLDRHNKEHI